MKKISILLIVCVVVIACFSLVSCNTPKVEINITLENGFSLGEIDSTIIGGQKIMKGQDHVGGINFRVLDSQDFIAKDNKFYMKKGNKVEFSIQLFDAYYSGAVEVSINGGEYKKVENSHQFNNNDGKLMSQNSYISSETVEGEKVDIKIRNIKEMSATYFDWKLYSYTDANGESHLPFPSSGTVSMGGEQVDLYESAFEIAFQEGKLKYADSIGTAEFDYSQEGDSIFFEDNGDRKELKLIKNVGASRPQGLFLEWEVFEGETLVFEIKK